MTKSAIERTIGFSRASGAGFAALIFCLACCQIPARAQEPTTVQVSDFGVVPRPSLTEVLLRSPAAQKELRVSEAQIKERAEIQERRAERTETS